MGHSISCGYSLQLSQVLQLEAKNINKLKIQNTINKTDRLEKVMHLENKSKSINEIAHKVKI